MFDLFGDNTISGAYDGVVESPQASEFQIRMFGEPSNMTDGQKYLDDRSNTSFWSFDQSKITASLQNVLSSGIEAASRLAVQQAGDAINRNAQNQNPLVSRFFQNFQSTKTGAQINAGAYAIQAQNFLMNPIVWLVGVVLILFLVVRK